MSTLGLHKLGLAAVGLSIAAFVGGQTLAGEGTPCRKWLYPPQVACSGCSDTNNCQPCSGGTCSAVTRQVCALTFYSTAGNEKEEIIREVPCWVRYYCSLGGLSNNCNTNSDCGSVMFQQSSSGTTVMISEPGADC